ncbi:Fe/S biogenesis protein nfuA [uncultured Roseburia sp.]|uniref:NifU family protein n=1 Tax=Brotonthovivens ammoniilytica TaxID=2981725 RepID=A0ABT2TJG5_9FIRM|nr:NifU family protein [Brotonthovivens ammoniilytica]MCU6762352.1 NifU family protein [Brotonthovivens ammoniilytica]SCI69029.1 Fe/S biogenesis protein nfuA [uncultured Roseburia sp.]
MMERIQEVLEKKVRPALLEHEGDVKVLSFEEGILRIRLLGKCSGCPSARITTEELIQKEIMEAVPQVEDVVLVQETSRELMDFARRILNHENRN